MTVTEVFKRKPNTVQLCTPTWTGLKSNPDLNGERPLPARGIAWP